MCVKIKSLLMKNNSTLALSNQINKVFFDFQLSLSLEHFIPCSCNAADKSRLTMKAVAGCSFPRRGNCWPLPILLFPLELERGQSSKCIPLQGHHHAIPHLFVCRTEKHPRGRNPLPISSVPPLVVTRCIGTFVRP